MNKVKKFELYIKENTTYNKCAKELNITVQELKKYVNGELFPNKYLMEKIFILTQGYVQPIDFLFLYNYRSNIRDYIQYHIGLNIITPKSCT